MTMLLSGGYCHKLCMCMCVLDRSMQVNEGRFMMNNRCGFVLQPDCMRHPNYDPYDKLSLSRVDPPIEPVHIALFVSTQSICAVSVLQQC